MFIFIFIFFKKVFNLLKYFRNVLFYIIEKSTCLLKNNLKIYYSKKLKKNVNMYYFVKCLFILYPV